VSCRRERAVIEKWALVQSRIEKLSPQLSAPNVREKERVHRRVSFNFAQFLSALCDGTAVGGTRRQKRVSVLR
jgi:hypothetical protein